MRNSGIPWLGEVPSHWQVLPIRRIAKTVKTGKTPPSDSKFDGFEDGNILWFSPGDFREDGAFERSSRLVNQRAVKHGHVEIFAANSIYFIGIGATLGKACVSKIPASCNQQVNVISLSEGHDPDFFVYQLNSIRQDVFGLAEFTTMPILNQMGTKRIKVAIPPSEEQREISSYVKRISETYKSAIDAQQRLISSLREMRSKTIAETVKGNVRI
jgi:type I restriction enzyme S subunit